MKGDVHFSFLLFLFLFLTLLFLSMTMSISDPSLLILSMVMAMAMAMSVPSSQQEKYMGMAVAVTIGNMAAAVPSSRQENTHFIFNGFHNNISDISLSGIAILDSSGAIQLTNFSARLFGHALYRYPLLIKTAGHNNKTSSNSNPMVASSFSTTFVFSITPLAPFIGGHGLAFFITPLPNNRHVSALQYMGLLDSSNNGDSSNHLFAVEFDTVQDLDLDDIDGNHVGINVNSMVSVYSIPAAYHNSTSDPNQSQSLNLKSGRNIQAWIHYDGLGHQLNVSIANVGQPEPVFPLLSYSLDLSPVLQDTVYVGFSAGTGDISSVQSIAAWSFNSNGLASPLNLASLPQPIATARSSSLSRGAIAGYTLLALTFLCIAIYMLLVIYRRWRRLGRGKLEEEYWDMEYGPHTLSYKELSKATNGFAGEWLVGEGGFGRVYRGVLPSTGTEVAVKCLSNQSRQGVREFVAELSSMGRLSHRSLVKLQGWSRRRGSGELFLVYDYMPSGSLDKKLWHSSSTATATTSPSTPPSVLSWVQRYNILKDVAAALVYLHEEWEQQVLHRDVKSGNILLDANLNAKLGDFGLARLREHGKTSHTTLVVGTLGYLAPEYSQTGKATASSDVFSFGAVMLEVACGRRPLDAQRPDEEERVLVNWVFGLAKQGRLLEASDPKLSSGSGYVKEEMECVLQLGLICSNPNPAARPTMRQVLQILTGVKPLPHLIPFQSLQTTASPPPPPPSSSSSSSCSKRITLDTSMASLDTNMAEVTGGF